MKNKVKLIRKIKFKRLTLPSVDENEEQIETSYTPAKNVK